ncbi:hypothetical protein GCK32_009530 [Trichostrongylus colubriformis]|uniref:Uncharacterized protein n=1 Tax=Trichostrongylus colubriformis TaxID=6319 RepID=A0AAN8F738_TRICO
MLLWTCTKLESCCGTKCCVDKVLLAKFIGGGTIVIIVLILLLPCFICFCLFTCSILYWLL